MSTEQIIDCWQNGVEPYTMKTKLPKYYDCGICGHYHSIKWNGDCREDENRFTIDDIEALHGPLGWREVEMPTWDSGNN